MVALGEHGLPVPYAVAHNRHCVLMTMVDAVPLVQVRTYTLHCLINNLIVVVTLVLTVLLYYCLQCTVSGLFLFIVYWL